MKKSISFEFLMEAVVFIIGIVLVISDVVFHTDTQLLGALLACTAFLWYVVSSRLDTCMSRQGSCMLRFQFQYARNPGESWATVITMVETALSDSQLYGVVSTKNVDGFDKKIIDLASRANEFEIGGFCFRRLICFDANDPAQQETEDWLLAMIDEDHDPEEQYTEIRKALANGRFLYRHLPQALIGDFLVREDRSTGSSRLNFSFLSDVSHSRYRYDSGFYSWHEELCEDFKKLFLRLWDEAEKHTLAELAKPEEQRCSICNYWVHASKAIKPHWSDQDSSSVSKRKRSRPLSSG